MFLQAELARASGVALNVSGLDDVGAGVEVGAVDLLDQLRLRQHQHLGAVLERFGVVAEAGAAVVLLLRAVRRRS